MLNSQTDLIIADLHLHSKYSRAVSAKMDLFEIALWASRKGINLVTTGDWTHPLWFREIQNELTETEPGLFKLKKTLLGANPKLRFVLTAEVSNIYSQGGASHRIHTVVFSPSIAVCQKIIAALGTAGVNLSSDGRPIMGLSMIELTELLWSIDEFIFLLPAHVWTPWFSLYGSRSGFNSIDECFGRFADRITAIETGLSSDPIMNWSIPELSRRAIVSFSDAHSGQKLGREATLFRSTRSYNYFDLIKALKQNTDGALELVSTIEFFPEEGKYHYSGHRLCNVRLSPDEVKKERGLCPVCHRALTIGVMNRVKELSDNLLQEKDLPTKLSKSGAVLIYPPLKNRPPFVSAIPLMEIIAHLEGTSPQSKKVQEKYLYLIEKLGSEFGLLLFDDLKPLEDLGEEKLAEALSRVRQRQVRVEPGYDGVFGTIGIDVAEEPPQTNKQATLF